MFAVVVLVLPSLSFCPGCLGREGAEGSFPLAHQEQVSLVESPGGQVLLVSLLTKRAECLVYAAVISVVQKKFLSLFAAKTKSNLLTKTSFI